MRVVLVLIGLLLFFPAQAPAKIIGFDYLNSEVQFGSEDGFYFGYDRNTPWNVNRTTLPDEFFAYLVLL